MKTIICLLVVAGYLFTVTTEASPHTWRATLTVVDDNNKPVAGAEVSIFYAVIPPPGQSLASEAIKGKTDTNGVFSASHTDGSLNLLFWVQKTNHYKTTVGYEVGTLGQPIDLAKLKITETLLLKTIGQPIPMYAKHIHGGLSTVNETLGYDLIMGDWVAPYGKGQTPSILFKKQYKENAKNDYDSKVIVSFPNTGDGIQEFLVDGGSELRSPHNAPEIDYQPRLIREHSEHADRTGFFDYDPNRNYFIRVQTILDAQGNVRSALYGKIYGDFMDFSYFLNPEPNSRNVEFDPKRNLQTNIKEFDEQVKVP